MLDAGGHALHEDRHGRDVDAAVGADVARLGHRRRHVAGQERGLVGGEGELPDVVVGDVLAGVGVEEVEVDDGELLVGVGLGRGRGGVAEEEADGDDQVAPGVEVGLDVRLEVGLGRRLEDLRLDAELLGRRFQAVRRPSG